MPIKKAALLKERLFFINQPKNLVLDLASVDPKKGVQGTKTNKTRQDKDCR